MRAFSAVSLFCGAGGFDMAFERDGFRTNQSNDFDKDACKTHHNWSKAKVVCNDIGKLYNAQIPDFFNFLIDFPGSVGVYLNESRQLDDSRNVLYKHFIKELSKKNEIDNISLNCKKVWKLIIIGKGMHQQ